MDSNYLTTQVSTIISQLHGLFDEIGVPSHERESRESELFSALSETLHNQLRLVTAEKSELIEEAQRTIKLIKQIEASLEDQAPSGVYKLEGEELKVTVPLTRCLQELKEKHHTISKIHCERFEQVKKLVQALESYSSHLEPSFIQITLPPTSNNSFPPPTFDLSLSYVTSLDREFSRVYEEYTRRIGLVKVLGEEIVKLWAELGTPQAQTESSIVNCYREAPEQLGLHENDIRRLQAKCDRLIEEKCGRERKLKELKNTIEGLWSRLGVDEVDRKRFLAGNRGCGLRVINEFEAELHRLKESKRQNLHLFIEDARYKLQELWDSLYFSEEEMLEFAPAFSEVYSDALLSAHEAEISRLEALREQRAPILQLIEKHRSLIKDRDDLTAASQDASRLLGKNNKGEKRDPTRLLREEKMRKRIAKELPKVEVELKKSLQRWEDDYGRPFLIHGVRYLDELAAAATKPLPPRSKTPSGPPPTTQKVPLKSVAALSSSRAGSVMRAYPPSRSTTATPAGTIKRNPMGSSVTATGERTPSRIPARVPLGNMQHGENSPERRVAAPELPYDASTLRKMCPPAKAPPPKMRDFFVPPSATPSGAHEVENMRYESMAPSTAGSVRHITPEDIYDDRERMSYLPVTVMQPERDRTQSCRDTRASAPYNTCHKQYMQVAESRQISTTSTSTTAASGSENWETFDDASEPEVDLSKTHYATLRAAKTGKRFEPEGGYTPPQSGPEKKMKGVGSAGIHGRTIPEERGRRLVTGSESAWTDEDAS